MQQVTFPQNRVKGRHASADPGRLPDFIIIGAMKSGTTTLVEMLRHDKRIFMCHPKEPQYFSRNHVYARGERWYRTLFEQASGSQVCGEASTCYSRWPQYADPAGRIARAIPDVRLIYLMRHPVERAYSHYRHLMEEHAVSGSPILTFEQALRTIPEIVEASLYLMQIQRYLAHFPRERFLFLTLDELRATPKLVLARVQEFLGLAPISVSESETLVLNRAGTRIVNYGMRQWVGRMRQVRGVTFLVGFLPSPWRGRLRRWLVQSNIAAYFARAELKTHMKHISPMSLETRRELATRLREPTMQLEDFLGEKLPDGWSR